MGDHFRMQEDGTKGLDCIWLLTLEKKSQIITRLDLSISLMSNSSEVSLNCYLLGTGTTLLPVLQSAELNVSSR